MAVDETRNVIDHAREFHEQVGEYYHRLADTAQRTRVRLLLDYMSAREERLATALAEYESSAPAKVLHTWLRSGEKTGPLQEVREQLRNAPVDSSANVDEIIALGMKLTECLLTAYRDLASNAEPEEIRQVFENLVKMEEESQQQFARDAGRLSDV